MDQEHKESWHMRISNKPLTVRVKLMLLVLKVIPQKLKLLMIFLKLSLNVLYQALFRKKKQ